MRICRCGHERAAHEHYRAGSDCALCADCPRFRARLQLPAGLRRLVRSLRQG
jgi:hypothetical protein